MIKYTCQNCGATFKRLSNMEEKSEVPCARCYDGVMTAEEV